MPHKSLTARTCDLLREAIVRARYAPGQKLRIDQIGRELSASSGAVREALSRLTAEGLVIAEPQKGFVVSPISRRDLQELTEVRIAVECRCLAESIAQGDVDWEARVVAVRHRLAAIKGSARRPDAPEVRRWHATHLEFHDALASACPNRWWGRLRSQLFTQSERYRRLSGPFDETGRDVEAEHNAIADAALARDVEAATAALTVHLSRTTEILLNSRILFVDVPPAPDSGGAAD
ncbi:GntR family transcriptional regulator [Tistlia consotensis]|nr:GntR family transcriptional regulator [Tistlia consotensis]